MDIRKTVVLACIIAVLTLNCSESSESNSTGGSANETEPVSTFMTEAEKINWRSYDEGVKLGKEEGKKVFINFYADWCHYCKMLDKKTFVNQDVIDYLNQHFIPVKVNSDKNTSVAQKYQVRNLPVMWILSQDGEPIGQQPGFMPPEKLLPILKFVGTDSYKKMKYKEFLKTL